MLEREVTGEPGAAPGGAEALGPSDSLRIFGAVYQALREKAGFTQESLAPEIQYSSHYIASVEQGRRLPSETFIERSEEALDAGKVLRKAAKYLCRRRGFASWFRVWAGLEEQALNLYTYENRLVPGLLQTEAYARTLFGGLFHSDPKELSALHIRYAKLRSQALTPDDSRSLLEQMRGAL
ncbi:Scr1 family TA system antitoxin-like transcriptional regulator [Streptomyces angustmyceticus]